jgi:hypothetical protein
LQLKRFFFEKPYLGVEGMDRMITQNTSFGKTRKQYREILKTRIISGLKFATGGKLPMQPIEKLHNL